MIARKSLIASSLVLLLAAGIAGAGFRIYRRIHPASLAAWAEAVARPQYKLRYRTRTRTHDVALFQVGPDQLAFCSRRTAAADGDPQAEVAVTDMAGNSLVDPARPAIQLRRVWNLGVTEYRVLDGVQIPIQAGFSGRMRVVFDAQDSAQRDESDPSRLGLLDVHLEWGDPTKGSLPRN